MKSFFTFLKTELKLSVRDMNMVIFAIIMPLVIFIVLGVIFGAKPAYDGADYTFLEQSFGAVSAVAVCASGLMGLPLAVSGLREIKILKRLRVLPVRPVFILGAELTMYIFYCAASLATLSVAALLWGVRLHVLFLLFSEAGCLPCFRPCQSVCWWAALRRTRSRPASLPRFSISPCWPFPVQHCRLRSCQRQCRKSSAFSR